MVDAILVLSCLAPFMNSASLLFLSLATFTENWEYVEYDLDLLMGSSVVSDVSVGDEYFMVNLTHTGGLSPETENGTFFSRKQEGGLWQICGVVSDAVYHQFPNLSRCMGYFTIYSTAEEAYMQKSYRIMMQLTRSAETCAIVTVIVVVLALPLGFISVLRQQVVSTMVTAICMLCGGFYAVFTVSLWLIRTTHEEDAIITADTFEGNVLPLLEARTLTAGWSVAIQWVAIVFCLLASLVWTLLYFGLKRITVNGIVKYRQLCGE